MLLVAALSLLIMRGPQSDPYGIRHIYRTDPDGMVWEPEWEDTDNVWFDDPWVEIGSGQADYRVEDDVLSISGAISRIYVRDPDKQQQWNNVEITVYVQRIADGGVPYSGAVTAAHTNHLDPEVAPCDSRGLLARLRFDGTADFGKETHHPTTIATDPVQVFPDGLPYNQWIGYKHIVQDVPGGTHQELWIDLTEGKDGGDWKLIASHDDFFGDGFGEEACAPGVDPTLPLTGGSRPGSESDLPNLTVLFRADDIGFEGLRYRAMSVRSIIPSVSREVGV